MTLTFTRFCQPIASGGLIFALAACAPSNEPIDLKCVPGASQICAAHSKGGQITWKTGQAAAQTEYLVVILSRETTQTLETFQHQLSIISDVGTSPRSKSEKALIDRVLQTQRSRGSEFAPDFDDAIQAPRSNFYYPGMNLDPFEIYVPHPRDYLSRHADQLIPFYVHSPQGDRLTGKTVQFSRYESVPENFDLYFDPRLREASTPQRFDEFTSALSQCLRTVVPNTLSMIGRPFNLDGKEEINMIITQFEGSMGKNTAGLFSSIDRFKYNGKEELADSNYGEYVYLAPRIGAAGKSCATAAHELQHMVSFDYKVLSQLKDNERANLRSKEKKGLNGEDLGLDEGYSHIIEYLTEQHSVTGMHLYNFFINPNLSSFALETQFSNKSGNSRSRGLNTLLLLYALNRAGGTLNATDPKTRDFLASLITSPKTGFDNIATYFNENSNALLEDFFLKLMLSLYDSRVAQSFIPPIESRVVSALETIHRGFSVLDRSASFESIPFRPPSVHPYQFPLQDLNLAENLYIPAQGVLFYRFNSASELPKDSEIRFSTEGHPFSVFIIRPL